MSKKSLAPRSRTPKPGKVVPIVSPESQSPADKARWEFEFQSEMVGSNYLRGVRAVLDAWMVYERDSDLSPNYRDDALMFLGEAVERMGERLEGLRLAWHTAEKAEAATKSA